MVVILSFILLVLLFRVTLAFFRGSELVKHKVESLFCFISYCIMILLAMFRGSDVGTDTLSYIQDYNDMSMMNLSEIIDRYKGYEGYYLLSKLFSTIGLPCFIWFGFVEFILVSALARFINKFSTDRLFSIILFLTTGLFMFSLAGLKQTMGMSLIFHAYIDFVNKKYSRSFILIVFAYFVHPASLIALFAFIIYFIRNTKFVLPILLTCCSLLYLGGLSTTSWLVSIIGNEHFEMYLQSDTSYTMSTLFLFFLICLCTAPYMYRYYKKSDNAKVQIACVVLMCALQYLASLSPSLFRLAFPLIPFLYVYVPNTYNIIKNKGPERLMLKLCVLLGPILFFAYSNRSLVYTTIFQQ